MCDQHTAPLPLYNKKCHCLCLCATAHQYSLSHSHSIFHLINLYYAVSSSFRNRQWSGTESVYSSVGPVEFEAPFTISFHWVNTKHTYSIFSFIVEVHIINGTDVAVYCCAVAFRRLFLSISTATTTTTNCWNGQFFYSYLQMPLLLLLHCNVIVCLFVCLLALVDVVVVLEILVLLIWIWILFCRTIPPYQMYIYKMALQVCVRTPVRFVAL